jgi:hypothetical protein
MLVSLSKEREGRVPLPQLGGTLAVVVVQFFVLYAFGINQGVSEEQLLVTREAYIRLTSAFFAAAFIEGISG